MANKVARNPTDVTFPTLWSQLEKAWRDFLAVPSFLVFGLLLLALVMVVLDRNPPGWVAPAHDWLTTHLFTSADSTQQFLGTVLGGMMTVTSLTITTLLIALQQSASKLGIQVTNHFLDRRRNQIVFGLLIGVAVYLAVTYAAGSGESNHVFSATVALMLVLLVLYGLIMLLWMAVNQMRPIVLMSHIHDQTLQAGQRLEQEVLARTRREPVHPGPVSRPVRIYENGYVTGLDVERLGTALAENERPAEIVIQALIGDHVVYGAIVAEIRAESDAAAAALVEPVREAFAVDVKRDISCDPLYGLYHFEVIAWSSVSTAIDDPEIGIQTLQSVHDVGARWLAEAAQEGTADRRERLAVVYADSRWPRLFDVVESLAIVSSESMQHQVYATALETLNGLFPELPAELQERAVDVVRRLLAALGDFVPAHLLEVALKNMADTLESHGYRDAAEDVRRAWNGLAKSVGALNSRATRVPGG